MTYADYIIKITDTMKIRSTNYRESQNDIIIMANNVYYEVAIEVNIAFVQQKVLIDKDTDEYDIDALYVNVANEIVRDVQSIKDENGLDVSDYFREIGRNKFKANRYINEEKNYRFLSEYDGTYMTFNRPMVPDIEDLTGEQQALLFPVISDGMLYYIHDAIPNPVGDGNPMGETNFHYQRYQRSKMNLKNMLPQRI